MICLSLLLAACPRPVRPPAPVPTVPPTPTPSAPDTRGATVYEVDSRSSQLSILVFRGGKLSRLGHNHVMTSQDVGGRAGCIRSLRARASSCRSRSMQLVVDDPQARRAAGSDFPPDIPQSDKDGTRKNMLKPELLDGERYPEVKVTSAKVGRDAAGAAGDGADHDQGR